MASRAHRWKGDDTPLTGVNYYAREKKGLAFYYAGLPKKARAAMARPSPITPEETAQLAAERRFALLLSKLPPPPKIGSSITTLRGPKPGEEPRKDRVRPRARPRVGEPLMETVARLQGGVCVLCQWKLEFIDHRSSDHPLRPSWDHVVPRSLGGGNEGNRLVAHRQCNSDKSNREPSALELAVLRKVNAALAPPKPTQ